MSKFNNEATIKTTNHSGNTAYAMPDKDKLVTQVLTSFFNEEKFYGDNSDEIIETLKAVIKDDPEFVSNLAVFARREFNMRSISHVLTSYLANAPEGKPYVKKTVKGVVLRGDDVTEILSYYINTFGKPIPNSLRRGLRDILSSPKFDAYTLAKYKGEGKSFKMRDAICLCRPNPKDEQQSANFKKLLEGTLETPYTWETELSARGNTKDVWQELIASGKVGYMALLRNMRNILSADPSNLDEYLKKIADPQAVKNSKQLPFRFLSAFIANANAGSKVLDALEDAAEASIENIERIPGKTVIAIDCSGSMSYQTISEKSDVHPKDIAMLLGLIANKICDDSIVVLFDYRVQQMAVSTRSGILQTAYSSHFGGGGTDMYLPFYYLLDKNIKCDRMIILSDNECNTRSHWHNRRLIQESAVQSAADEYRRETGNDIWVHAVDLMGYGTQQFAGHKTNIIAGWSEKVFQFINLAEQGTGSMVKHIKEYSW